MDFYVRQTSKIYPYTYAIDLEKGLDLHQLSQVFDVISSPTANCQAFSIAYIREIRLDKYTNAIIKKLFKFIYEKITDKRILFIDVEMGNIKKQIIAKLRPISKDIKCMNYTSTNGSRMSLCIVYLDIDKILEDE